MIYETDAFSMKLTGLEREILRSRAKSVTAKDHFLVEKVFPKRSYRLLVN